MAPFYLMVIGLGVYWLAAAVFNWESLFCDPESLVVEYLGGETAVRWYGGIAGVALIGMTIYIWVIA